MRLFSDEKTFPCARQAQQLGRRFPVARKISIDVHLVCQYSFPVVLPGLRWECSLFAASRSHTLWNRRKRRRRRERADEETSMKNGRVGSMGEVGLTMCYIYVHAVLSFSACSLAEMRWPSGLLLCDCRLPLKVRRSSCRWIKTVGLPSAHSLVRA